MNFRSLTISKKAKNFLFSAFSLLLSILAFQCTKVQDETIPVVKGVPTVTTLPVSSWGKTFIEVGGAIGGSGNEGDIIQRGIIYAHDSTGLGDPLSNPTAREILSDSAGYIFTIKITSLPPNTLFAYRAFAANSKGRVYGEVFRVGTNYGPTARLSSISAGATRNERDTIFGSFILEDTGGTNIIEMGIMASELANQLITDNNVLKKVSNGNLKETINAFINSGLSPNTQYYVRAYARNMAGVAYTDEIAVTTSGLPDVIMGNIRQALDSVRFDVRIEKDGSLNLDSVGILLAPFSAPNNFTIKSANVQVFLISNPKPLDNRLILTSSQFVVGNKFKIKAFAKNVRGFRYTASNEFYFTPIGGYLTNTTGNGTIYSTTEKRDKVWIVLDTILNLEMAWGCIGDTIKTSSLSGTSANNTSEMRNKCGLNFAGSYVRTSNSSWDLPSFGDFKIISDTLLKRGVGNPKFNTGDIYWSSSETSGDAGFSRAKAVTLNGNILMELDRAKQLMGKIKVVRQITL